MQGRETRLDVANIVVSVTTEPETPVYGHVDSFLSSEPAEARVSIRLSREGDRAEEVRLQAAFAEHPTWKAFHSQDGRHIIVERVGGRVQARFAAAARCDTVEVLFRTSEAAGSDGKEAAARELGLIEVLPVPVVALLSGRRGLFLHSCGVNLMQQGILFSGVSGSGKSTMGELWRRFGPTNSHLIDDEHILARLEGETTWLYGAPWSRGPFEATHSRTPLKAVFFLSHGTQNRCIRMSHSEALAELMSQVFLPVWSREQMELTTQTCAELLGQVDSYRLPFVPDHEVIRFVQEILQNSN